MTQGFAEQLAIDLPPEDVRHVLGVFAADMDRLWHLLAAATDTVSIRRTAHALAGAAGAVGAASLEAACRAAMANTADDQIDAHRARIATAIDEARAACARHGVTLP